MKLTSTVLLVLLLNSCTPFVYDAAPPKHTQQPRPEFGTTAPNCWHLYDNDAHREWADCMGVKYL